MTVFDELASTMLLFLWVIFVTTILTRKLYSWMKNRGVENNVAIYYNRKIIHILTGGVCASAVPYLFTTPVYPLAMAMLLAFLTYIPHKIGRLMYWFQTEKNVYEVTFTLMWGVIIASGWLLSDGDFLIGVLPVLFMSIGDAITGIVRNYLYGKRTKSWWGNLAMAAVSIPIGATLGIAGVLSGSIASVIEHFEFYPIDDNITVPLTSFAILVLAKFLAPWLLTF
jgi:dolichol kinase